MLLVFLPRKSADGMFGSVWVTSCDHAMFGSTGGQFGVNSVLPRQRQMDGGDPHGDPCDLRAG